MSVRGPDYVEEAKSSRLHCFIGYDGRSEEDIYSVDWYWMPDNYFKSKENQVFKPSKERIGWNFYNLSLNLSSMFQFHFTVLKVKPVRLIKRRFGPTKSKELFQLGSEKLDYCSLKKMFSLRKSYRENSLLTFFWSLCPAVQLTKYLQRKLTFITRFLGSGINSHISLFRPGRIRLVLSSWSFFCGKL